MAGKNKTYELMLKIGGKLSFLVIYKTAQGKEECEKNNCRSNIYNNLYIHIILVLYFDFG